MHSIKKKNGKRMHTKIRRVVILGWAAENRKELRKQHANAEYGVVIILISVSSYNLRYFI